MPNDPKARVQVQFGPAAGDYATSEVHARGESLAVLLELVRPQPQWKVLDVATGAGHTAFTFAPEVGLVIAVDLTGEMVAKTAELALAKALDNVHPVVGDAEALPFGDGCFDLVTCRLSFHHFANPHQALGEFSRVLRPGGLLGFADNFTVEAPEAARYYNEYERLRDPSHHCVYSLARLREMFTRSGLALKTTRELTKEFEFAAWADRQKVSAGDKDRLLQMMRELPDALQPLFSPRWADGTLYFNLWEAVLLAEAS